MDRCVNTICMWARYFGGSGNWGIPDKMWGIILPFAVVDLIMKGFALWRSARRGESIWFVFLLIINSSGILPAFYLLTHKGKSTAKKS